LECEESQLKTKAEKRMCFTVYLIILHIQYIRRTVKGYSSSSSYSSSLATKEESKEDFFMIFLAKEDFFKIYLAKDDFFAPDLC
jgi:hypothetical protein